jgi:hypothetical protein
MAKIRKIPGYRNYWASTQGKIYLKDFDGSLIPIKKSLNNGYYKVHLRIHKGIQVRRRVGVLVALAWIPNPENKPEVNHIDLDKTNDRKSNLEWMTQKENIQHAWSNGACESHRGQNHYKAKLTDIQVQEIRDLRLRYNLTYRELGRRYKVTSANIGYIIRLKTRL